MRTLTIFTLLVLLNLSSIAQEGKYYRFKIKVQLKDKSELTGYIYTDSLKNYFNYSENNRFTEFVKHELGYPLTVYKEIIDLDYSGSYNSNFGVDNKLCKIELTDINEISLLDKKLYSVKPRLVLLNESEYKLLQKELKLSLTVNNSNDTEECLITFLYFGDKLDIVELKDNILPIIAEIDNDLTFEERTEYIDQAKEKLIGKEIIVFELCN